MYQEVDSLKNVQVFPNPSSTGFNISVRDPKEIKSIALVDMTSRQLEFIDHENVRKEQTMGAQLGAGIYILQIKEVRSNKQVKVVKK